MTATKAAKGRGGRRLTRAEIVRKYAMPDGAELAHCQRCVARYGGAKVTYPDFAAAKSAAVELANLPTAGPVIHLVPCRVNPYRWHHTARKVKPPRAWMRRGMPNPSRWVVRRPATGRETGCESGASKANNHTVIVPGQTE